MKLHVDYNTSHWESSDVKLVAAYAPKTGTKLSLSWSDKELVKEFNSIKSAKNFKATANSTFSFTNTEGATVVVIGMGEKAKAKAEQLRKAVATAYHQIKGEKI